MRNRRFAATTTAAVLTARYPRRTPRGHAQRARKTGVDHRGEHQERDEHVRSADAGIRADNLGISAVYNAGGALLLLAMLIAGPPRRRSPQGRRITPERLQTHRVSLGGASFGRHTGDGATWAGASSMPTTTTRSAGLTRHSPTSSPPPSSLAGRLPASTAPARRSCRSCANGWATTRSRCCAASSPRSTRRASSTRASSARERRPWLQLRAR